MGPADAADGIGGEGDTHTPDDGHLPEAGLSASKHSRVDGTASEKNENKRAERFGEQSAG